MRVSSSIPVVLLSAVPAAVLARTDISGCISSTAYFTEGPGDVGASLVWYVPGTGELCTFIDCGGGMAPPMTDVPGCPLYKGTATVTPSFLPGFGKAANTASVTPTSTVFTTGGASGGDSSSTSSPAPTTAATGFPAANGKTTLTVTVSSQSGSFGSAGAASPSNSSSSGSTSVSVAAGAMATGRGMDILGLVAAGVAAGLAAL